MTSPAAPGFSPAFRTRAAALCLLFLAAYRAPLLGLVHVWTSNEDYSYGPLIPLASLYLLWEQRAVLSRVPRAGCWRFLPPLLATVALSLYGVLGSSGNIALPSLPVLMLLFAAFCFGPGLARRLLLPLGFLIFMVPVPAVLERTLGLYLKSVSTALGGGVLRGCGIPVFVSGNVIDLGMLQLQVVDACNGLRYLYPLIAVGVLYAYLFERVFWKRLSLVAASVPIAVLVNGLRIGITGLLANRYGVAAAEGFFHDFTGWVMFLVACAVLLAAGKLLALLPPGRGAPGGAPFAAEPGTGGVEAVPDTAPAAPFCTALALLLLVGALTWSTGSLPPVRLAGGMAAFPTRMAQWSGVPSGVAAEAVAASGAQDAFAALYRDPRGEEVSLYLGYRGSAFLENENFFHSPTVCLSANGLTVLNTKGRTISADPVWGKLRVTEMLIESEGSRMLVYFWFHTKSRETGDKNLNRFHLTLHALSRDNTYDMFLRPITVLAPGEPVQAGEERLDRFSRELSAATRSFVARQGR
jgi:exosortase D (VPLPA-CTERM-specific)